MCQRDLCKRDKRDLLQTDPSTRDLCKGKLSKRKVCAALRYDKCVIGTYVKETKETYFKETYVKGKLFKVEVRAILVRQMC